MRALCIQLVCQSLAGSLIKTETDVRPSNPFHRFMDISLSFSELWRSVTGGKQVEIKNTRGVLKSIPLRVVRYLLGYLVKNT